jgi:multisubunit Na+/H+ antiporter MnhG subunit
MAFGALVVAWAVALLPDLYEFFGEQGIEPQQPHWDYEWGIFNISTSDTAVVVGWALLLLAAIALTIGWHSRLAAVVVFVLIQSFMQRERWVMNGGDALMSVEAMFLALSSCGAALSLDQRRRAGSFWSAQCRAPWPLRLLQVQMSLIYLVNVQAKLAGKSWLDGSAASYAWRAWPLFPAPDWLTSNALLVNAATWGTILIELAIAILVWNRRCRPWVLGAGVMLHVAIMITIAVGFHSLAIFVLYLAFVPWQTAKRLPEKLKRPAQRAKPDSEPVNPAQ